MKLIKAKKPADKTFLHFIRSVKKAVNYSIKPGEQYDARTRYNKAEDGLRKFDYDSGTYVDANDSGVPTLNETITKS